MADDLASVRHQLCKLAAKKKCRVLDQPRDWRPGEVLDPHRGQPFTREGAWEYIVKLLNDPAVALEEVVQDNPPGKKAYVMHVASGNQPIYIKLRLGTGCVLGRSFHYSETRQEDAEASKREEGPRRQAE